VSGEEVAVIVASRSQNEKRAESLLERLDGTDSQPGVDVLPAAASVAAFGCSGAAKTSA
jgi:hypothetical protein